MRRKSVFVKPRFEDIALARQLWSQVLLPHDSEERALVAKVMSYDRIREDEIFKLYQIANGLVPATIDGGE